MNEQRVQRARRARRRYAGASAVVAVVVAVGLSVPAGAQTGSVPGVTDKSVKIGFISSETGVASETGKGAIDACKARIGRANAEGGVAGRRIEVEYVDDQSGPGNLDIAKDLVQNRNVFAVVNNSALAFFAYRYLVDQGVPVVGGGFDGTYYYDKGNESIISGLGGGSPVPGLTFDIGGQVMKKLGGTKVAAVGYGISPSSSENAQAVYQYGGPSAGLKPTYINKTVDFGSTDVGPVVLGIKNSGADALWLPLNPATNLAIIQGLQQNGADMKAVLSATGYGQALLESPVAATLTDRDVFMTGFRPVELGGKAVKQLQADRKKFGGKTGAPGWGEYTGYVTCDIVVHGLELAGKDLTRKGFVDAIRNAGEYDVAGLTCQPHDYSLANYGKVSSTYCQWGVVVEDGKFKILNKGKPFVGKVVGDPALVAKYTAGGGGITTTTAPAG